MRETIYTVAYVEENKVKTKVFTTLQEAEEYALLCDFVAQIEAHIVEFNYDD